MKKRVLLIIATVAAVCVMTGCTKTETVTTTDADGNTVTKTTETVNGEESTYYENVPMAIENALGGGIYELHISMSDNDQWGDNLLADGYVLEDGTVANGLTVSYSADQPCIDVLAIDSEGTEVTFESVDLSPANGESFTLMLEYDESDDGFYAYVK